jgi:acetyltransferase-like isoleucine patch superfamily enzyme
MLVAFCFVVTLPFIVLTRLWYIFNSNRAFDFFGCLLSLIPGRIGSYLRVGFYKGTVKSISSDTYIGFCSFFSKPGVEIEKNVGIGAFSIVGDVILESNVLISSRCSIMSTKNQHEEYTDPLKHPPSEKPKKIKIGYHSWIGENCVVMADVGSNCIVSSGSVVTRDMPDNIIAVGNPARPLPRKKD